MWRTAVLFGSVVILFVGGLFFVRQQPPAENLVVFLGDDSLYRMTVDGRVLRQITDGDVRDFAISPSRETIAYTQRAGSETPINLIKVDGTSNHRLISERRPRWMVWSPDERQLAYIAHAEGVPHLFILDIRTHQRVRLSEEEQMALFPPTWGARGLVIQSLLETSSIDISVTDTQTRSTIWLVSIQAEQNLAPVFSPDDEWIAFAATGAYQSTGYPFGSYSTDNDLRAIYHDGRGLRLVTVGLDVRHQIFWTDDWIVFSASPGSSMTPETTIYKVKPDGSQLTMLTDRDLYARVADVSPDGEWVLAESWASLQSNGSIALLRVHIDGSTVEEIPTPFTRVKDARWAAPISLNWHPIVLLLAGMITGGVHVAYRRYIV